MSHTQKALLASGVSLLACAALLAGSTFAWFTDSVTNSDNKIKAGKLAINAFAYDLTADGSYQFGGINEDKPFGFDMENGQNLREDTQPILDETLWEPGKSSARLLEVRNDGTLSAKIRIDFTVQDGGLADALWFDFVQVKDGAVAGGFEKRPMSTLETFAENLELPLSAGGTVQFILLYGMEENAGNVFMGKNFTADVTILATQYTGEKDGFGNDQYDKDAEYAVVEVSDAAEFVNAAAEGKSIRLAQSIVLDRTVEFADEAILMLNGNTLTVADGTGHVKAAPGSMLTVYGSGTIEGTLYADKNAVLTVSGGEHFAVNSSADWAVYGASGASVTISGGTYTSAQKGAGVIHILGSSLTIKDAVIDVGAASVLNSTGIHSAAKENVLENVTVHAAYSRAANFNLAGGNVVIRGGSFVTDQVADGWSPNPTIQYSGTLDIADAEITHIGNGILFYRAYPKPTEVEGLTCERCTFHAVDNTAYEEIAFK